MTTKVPVELFDAGAGFTIGSGAAEDTKIVFDGNAQDFYIGLDDSADDLLIGLGSTVGTTPAISIDENVNVELGSALTVDGFSDATGHYISLRSGYSPDESGGVGFQATDHSGSHADGLGIYGHDGLTFYTAQSERGRIDSSGNVLLGDGANEAITYTTANKLIMHHGHAFGNIGIMMSCGAYTSGYELMRFYNGNGVAGNITVSGSNTAFNTSSDYRLKENVTYDWDATTRLKQLKPARFNWIADATNTLVDGFLAHEVSGAVSDAVSGEKDAVYTAQDEANGLGKEGEPNMQSIDHSKLVPLLVKTIQELEARITTLEGS